MLIDQVTIQDLGIIGPQSLYNKVNICKTQEGSDYLYQIMLKPTDQLEQLLDRQAAIQFLMNQPIDECFKMTNGTLVMIRKFFESNEYGSKLANDIALQINSFVNKIVNKEHLNYTTFILEHIKDLLATSEALIGVLAQPSCPKLLQSLLPDLSAYQNDNVLENIQKYNTEKDVQNLKTTHHIRRYCKNIIQNVVACIVKIDAYYALAKSTKLNQWTIPTLLTKQEQTLSYQNLRHPLLSKAIGYHINFNKQQNLLILTGANMSGKSTFLRSLGLAQYMAQIGIGIPADKATISVCSSIISNMRVQDNIFEGESYFYAEVKRMKHTAQQITQQDYNLVLMDEIFKGTNIYDAYDCSISIIDSLKYQQNNFFVISTHLYEIKDRINKNLENVFYKYFETLPLPEYQFQFTYQLKDGVCQDRIGYSVLKQEGVLDILNKVQS